jgi:hypothetical protein
MYLRVLVMVLLGMLSGSFVLQHLMFIFKDWEVV